MTRKLKLGFVGTGGMGQMAHLSNYAVLKEECEVVAIAEPRPQLAQTVAARYGIPQVFSSHEELLLHGGVDAIIAAQPYTRHSILIPDILRAGLPVFTEKPLTLSVSAGEKLASLSEELGVLHMVGYHKRSDPAMEYAKKLVEEWKQSGEFGKLNYIRVTMPPGDWVSGADMPLGTDEAGVPGELEPLPPEFDQANGKKYDIFVNYYIHQVNAIRFLLGEPYKVTFADRSGVLLAGESESGVCVTLEMAPYSTSIEWHEGILVAFEKGFIKIDLPAPLVRQIAGRVIVMRDNGKSAPSYSEPIMPNVSAMRNQAKNFLAAVRGERPAPCAAKEALEDLKVARDYIQMMAKY
ncbi:gfo/Idh/MocA family oxidoreductase [Paenibacillus psychroresistens]|uniref:Gfo/Idh/MocA family oxidoreductase n=1 Tax=Paenibacillus psychroresistens TaxID=1778678 RepID=A0A6B8RGN1_9BACL|nr:Gfo/Idh/MocA family oxidoreductase [Paenibacillus psychroresistens]QGQ94558.1 gfo/Idh/MocA family oxidoreductase [Paenibacillus psychroresistens]